MSIKLTKKQTVILNFIKEFMDVHDYSPSYREICAGLGLSSVSSVAEHIDHLVALGALKRTPGSARSLEIIDLSFPETTALFKSRMNVVSSQDREILQKAAAILGLDLEDDIIDK